MQSPNYNHFTGKKKPTQTQRRKFGKVKNTRTHKNKYSRFSKAEDIKKKRIHGK